MPTNIGIQQEPCSDTTLDIIAQGRNLIDSGLKSKLWNTEEALQKRAYRKCYSVLLHTQLAGLGGERQLYYFNCLRCADYIEQCEDGRLRSHYCNGRLCSICQAIRTAKAIRLTHVGGGGGERKID